MKQFSWKEYLETGKTPFPMEKDLRNNMMFILRKDTNKSNWQFQPTDEYYIPMKLIISPNINKPITLAGSNIGEWIMPYNFLKEHFEYIGG
jgi:hypothetical protein